MIPFIKGFLIALPLPFVAACVVLVKSAFLAGIDVSDADQD